MTGGINVFSEEVHAYWRSQMVQGSIVHFDEVFTLVSNAQLDEAYKAMILAMANNHTMAVVSPLSTACLRLDEREEFSIGIFRDVINQCELTLHPPDCIYYLLHNQLPKLEFSTDNIEVRPLSKTLDKKAYDQFIGSVKELDECYVSLQHELVYGAFYEGKLIGVCSMYLWNNTRLADLGVVVDEGYRDKGVATRLIYTLTAHLIEMGYVAQYRCQVGNEASMALAEAVGFKLFGEWEVIISDK